MTIREFYNEGTERLKVLYIKQEAEAIIKNLIISILKYSNTTFLMKIDEEIEVGTYEVLNSILEDLTTGKPLQYLLGETSFYGLGLYVNEGVLIPRQETEEIVDWIIQEYNQEKQILDIGVGSGCITVALSKNLNNAHLTAIDNSFKALDLARENCDKYQQKPTFMYGDILEWDLLELPVFDLIVSNPPYVMNSEKQNMHRNILEYEPEGALFVPDKDPLLFYNSITDFGLKKLKKGGKLYFEINENLGYDVVQLLKGKGYKDIILRQDINGKDRMVRAIL